MPGGFLHAKHGAPTAISVFQVVSKLQASQAGYHQLLPPLLPSWGQVL